MAGISEKINQPISYTQGVRVIKVDTRKPLLINSDSPDIAEYAGIVSKSAASTIGQSALYAFGNIGSDNATGSYVENGQTYEFGLVSSPVEYYFTQKVFVEKKYMDALIDLYVYMAEFPGKVSETKEAIEGTIWVASQDGQTLTVAQVEKAYSDYITKEIDRRVAEAAKIYTIVPVKAINEFVPSIKQYYLNPTKDNFDRMLTEAFRISGTIKGDKAAIANIPWYELINVVVGSLSTSISLALVSAGEKRLSVSDASGPVEVGIKDPTILAAVTTAK